MRNQKHRHRKGSGIDYSQPIKFKFDGKTYQAFKGDTLASALLANGVKLVARSFKYHRPRGILSCGSEEPNALVELRSGGRKEPNTRATVAEVYDGLECVSQNRTPSLRFDITAINDKFSSLLVAGFYYKTFMWPKKAWLFYEYFIRKAAGLGRASKDNDPDRYEKSYQFCDYLIAGGGIAGLSAAMSLAKQGHKVIIADEHAGLGGVSKSSNDSDLQHWIEQARVTLEQLDNVIILSRTTVFGVYDGMTFGLLERVGDHLEQPGQYLPRQRLITVSTKHIVYATGATERPIVFANNDRPGVMLASALRTYANYYGVIPGQQVVIFTNNNSVYDLANDLIMHGCSVIVIDSREQNPISADAAKAGIEVHHNALVVNVKGTLEVKQVEVEKAGSQYTFNCDVVAMSGGWSPNVHLMSHFNQRPVYNDVIHAFVTPDFKGEQFTVVGSAAGIWLENDCIESAKMCTKNHALEGMIKNSNQCEPLWQVKQSKAKAFVDFQNDVASKDIYLSAREGFKSVEHLKRYTTLGMATDQGKTANINALAILSDAISLPMSQIGTTIYRPPYTPVGIGSYVGRDVGQHFMPKRLSPMHDVHIQQQGQMMEVGHWYRPRFYAVRERETLNDAYIREMKHVREKVGMADVTSLGKIAVKGPDALEFLQRMYVNNFQKLAIGKVRYGFLLREDGFVLDDGTVSKIAEDDFLVTTTTSHAAQIMQHMEYHAQVVFPELKVHLASESDRWAGISLVGPRSRDVLKKVVDVADVDDASLPYMGFIETTIKGVLARVYRISFSGEMAYEINVPADYGEALWHHVMQQGQSEQIIAYGLEALGALRIEKGYLTGSEIDGRVSLQDLGMGKMAGNKKDYVGRYYCQRDHFKSAERHYLVGLKSTEIDKSIKPGSQILATAEIGELPTHSIGHVTSVTFSPELNCHIALAFIEGGLEKHANKKVFAHYPVHKYSCEVEVVSPIFIDQQGVRLHG